MDSEIESYRILSQYRSSGELDKVLAELSPENQEKARLILKLFSLKEERYN